MTTPHPEILAILREHWPEQVPRNYESCALVRWALCFRWKGAEAVTWDIKDHDAHAHIELAAIDAICEGERHLSLFKMQDADEPKPWWIHVYFDGGAPHKDREYIAEWFPTRADALLAALKTIVAAKGGGE